ncbi:MAG: hypothetical protein LBQ68_00695, partial [Clostridiales bacterium]|nr:hypothetical protein [Clostridiales bacterium]
MLKTMLKGRQGMKIRTEDGLETLGFPEFMGTPLFYYAQPGDRLRLLNEDYVYFAAIYAPIIYDSWVHTYSYAENEAWVIYRYGAGYRQ